MDLSSEIIAAAKHQDSVRNELALPRVLRFDDSRAGSSVRSIASLARGSPGHLPGATSRDIREKLASDPEKFVELLLPSFQLSTRIAALSALEALATRDISEEGGWHLSSDTRRQESLCKHADLIERLVTWLQACLPHHQRHVASVKEQQPARAHLVRILPRKRRRRKRAAPPVDSRPQIEGKKATDEEKEKTNSLVCLLICRCLRSLCVSGDSATRIACAVPHLVKVLEYGTPDCVQAAIGVLSAVATWQAHLLTSHGAVGPLVRMLHQPRSLCHLNSVQMLAQIASEQSGATRILQESGDDTLNDLALGQHCSFKTREAAIVTLVHLSTHNQRKLRTKKMDRIILTGLREEKGADKAIFHESCLILLCRFWSAPLAAEAAASVRRLLLSHKAHQAVLAAAAWCVAECYPRNSDRRLFAPFLQAPPSEYDDSLELRPGKYVYVVHGDDEQETAPVTPRDWEDAVSTARLGGEEKKSKSVLCVLFRMLFHPTSVALIERGLAALLNLCSDPETNRHVREKYYEDVLKIPETLTTGPATHIIAVSTKKFELLLLLSQIDLVEDSLFRLRDEESRRKFRKAVLRWRRFLGYKALSDVKEQFDEETLRKLQATFGEIDEDGSGYISGEELGGFFKNVLKMPLTKKELAEIIEEVDIDGNGCIDFEEFLLVVKNMKSMHKVQSRLGVVLEKKSKSLFEGVTLGSLVAFRAKKRAEKMKDDLAKTREKKQYDHDAHVEADAAKRHRISQRYKLSRLEMRRRWDRCAKETYSAVVKKNAGHVTLNSVLSLLRESPHLLEGLGFVAQKDDKGLRAVSTSPPYNATLFAKYAETCDVGAELGTYHDFEMALWRVARSHREKEEDRNFGNVA